jgi:hypothetical protein
MRAKYKLMVVQPGGTKLFKNNRFIFASLLVSLLVLPACAHSLRMHSQDGDELSGHYRFARENTGLIRILDSSGELLAGNFVTVGRATFVENYTKTFGNGSITVDGPDVSAYGNAFRGVFGSSHTIADSASGETFNSASGNSETGVRGPLFYWTASLRGDKGTTMGCYFIGSSYTGHGFGRCKTHTGKEYSAEF